MKKALYYGFALILVYLILVHWGGLAHILGSGGKAGVGVIEAFQGR
jgi:hypothetical protein